MKITLGSILLASLLLVGCNALQELGKFAGKYELASGRCSHDRLTVEISDELKAAKFSFYDRTRDNNLLFLYHADDLNSFSEECSSTSDGTAYDGSICTQRSVKFENGVLTDSFQQLVRMTVPGSGTKMEQVIIPWTVELRALFESDKITVSGASTDGRTCEYVKR